VLIEPTEGKSDNDLRYLLQWADSFRETRLSSGEVIRGSGRAVIFADMLQAVLADMPKALLAALLTTMAAVLLAFRAGPGATGVLLSLACGLAWLGGALALFDVRLNFLNFMALPITLGVGVDYAVNIRRRALQEGGDALAAVRTSGGAVVLCSLTTILGYLALLGSINQAVRSLGLVAVLGEVTCLTAAVLVLPAALLRKRRGPG
jgi:predicted RND superfamily exporter protein